MGLRWWVFAQTRGEDGASVVDIALKAGSGDCASELIKAGGSASSADDGGAARLRAAACAGDACLIERLIKAGLRPDACADDGRTALHLAAGEGASKVAAKLVELGADVKRADRQGRNALEIARAAGYYDLEARLRLYPAGSNALRTRGARVAPLVALRRPGFRPLVLGHVPEARPRAPRAAPGRDHRPVVHRRLVEVLEVGQLEAPRRLPF